MNTMQDLVGVSSAFSQSVKKLSAISRYDVTVLIIGETGTGKEVFARAIHESSPRSPNPFCVLDCGATPLDLIENELFGHERGAYTGAMSTQEGVVRACEGGTLFLDEIDCLPLSGQVKLLRLLQNREYRPLGSSRIYPANIRIVAATNDNLSSLIKSGRFRQDLYYRLSVVSLSLSPLRERVEDIPVLAEHFVKKYAKKFGKNVTEILPEAKLRLQLHRWPGNVRELEHAMERAVVFCNRDAIGGSDIEFEVEPSNESLGLRDAKAQVIARFEQDYLKSLLLAHNGNVTQAALTARKDRRAFHSLLKKHNIDPGRFRNPGLKVEV